MRIVAADEKGIAEARRLLAAGEVIAFPTETFYGLAADARNAAAVLEVFAAKGRPASSPVALIVRDLAMARALSPDELPEAATALVAKFWPGPLTLVIRAADSVSGALTAGTGTIGVRVSPHPVAAALAADFPITATSANPWTGPARTTAAEVARDMPALGFVLDGRIPRGSFAPVRSRSTSCARCFRA
jgi:L-threonylcarbamoyladenylate synthase